MLERRMIQEVLLVSTIVLALCLVSMGGNEADNPMPSATSILPVTEPSVGSGMESNTALIHLEPLEEATAIRSTEKHSETVAIQSPDSETGSNRVTGDDCSDPIILNIGLGDLPYTLTDQYTCGRGNDYDNTCLGNFDGGEDIIYELNLSEDLHLSILLDPKSSEFTGILIDDACPADPSTCIAKNVRSAAVPHGIINVALTSGVYYIMVDTWPPPACIPDFDLTIEHFVETPGDNCGDPVVVKLPADLSDGPNNDSYIDASYTCGRLNNYDNTCLEEEYDYDGGEDIIYQLNVTDPVTVDIFMDPGSTNWTGILIDDNCPPDEVGCIQFSTVGMGAHGLYDVALEPGTYYVMVDTYPYPDCIPTFVLTIRSVDDRLENDAWENCTAIGDAVDLPFSTRQATPDGPGGCLTSPTLWYCYTASCTGKATIGLCGSDYNTKLGVWDGTNPYYDPMLGCNDDACGQQSELKVRVVQGNTYLIGAGGWKNHTGDGILSTSCLVNDDCEDLTPVVLDDGVPVTFTGNNTNASHQCDFFDGGHTWHAFTIDTTMIVTLDYCTTDPLFTNAWLNLAIGCPCTGVTESGVYDFEACGDGNVTITWDYLDAGTYYYPVMLAEGADGPYTLHVAGETVLVYCYASGGCDNEFISRVVVGDIDNSSSCENYGDFTHLSTIIETDSTYPITIEIGSGISGDIGAAWIDWNQNYVFEYDEEIALDVSTGEGPYTGTIIQPVSAVDGLTRMRVRLNYNSYPPPCGETPYGEVEDYTVDVHVAWICGDADASGEVDIDDVVYLIAYIFSGGPEPVPYESGDADCSGDVDIDDVVWLISYIFSGGNEPCDTDGDGEPDC